MGELAGIVLLVAFVVALATLPPLQIFKAPDSVTGYSVKIDTKVWRGTVEQYAKTVQSGSLGIDYKKRSVGPLVADRMWRSLTLAGVAILLATALGLSKGFWDFHQLRRWKFAPGPVITSAVQGLPDFWLILMLQLSAAWLYKTFQWRPFAIIWKSDEPVTSLVYPMIALSLVPLASMARITCTAMSNVWDKDYIRTARAKGVHEARVIYKHAMRNAIVQVLDNMPGVAAMMVSNLLVVEYLFNYPGLTLLLKDAVSPPPIMVGGRPTAVGPDVPTLVAAGVALGLIFSALFLIINIMRRAVDPRLKERDQA